ncbi:MAG TPA: ribokinase [Phycisphaerae bacterium]|nr:ribokinase [Phycisphaerae bacterium]HRY68688.1 ribokinase [Phycisphaerae bacterium]HSA25514.1 ribokinase [Phycisphaerae bacterium]
MPNRKKPRVVVVGSLVFDCVALADRIPRKGETVLGQSFGTFSGGKGANQAVAAARLGAEVFMVGRVGQDDRARFLLANLNTSGVNTEFVKADPVAGTGACCIHVDAAGENTIIIVPQANLACAPEDVDAARKVIASADAVVCQLEIAMPAVVRAVDLANELGVRVILNPAPAGSFPAGLFAKATYLTPNETEAEFFTGVALPPCGSGVGRDNDWEARASARLLDMGPGKVIITLGQRGAYLATRNTRQLIPSYPVKAVDTTAAGDAFSGALALALAEGRSDEQAIAFANGAGALAATRAGSQPSLPTRQELDDFLRCAKPCRC